MDFDADADGVRSGSDDEWRDEWACEAEASARAARGAENAAPRANAFVRGPRVALAAPPIRRTGKATAVDLDRPRAPRAARAPEPELEEGGAFRLDSNSRAQPPAAPRSRTFLGRGWATGPQTQAGGRGPTAPPGRDGVQTPASPPSSRPSRASAVPTAAPPRPPPTLGGVESLAGDGVGGALDAPRAAWEPSEGFHEVGGGRRGESIVVVQRAASQPSRTATRRAKRPDAGPGWQNNFVRMNLKHGRGSSKYKASRLHTFKKAGRWRNKVAALAQVGDGADFVEGVRSRTSTCYKCGRSGHWAADCPGIEAASDDEAPAAPFSTHLQVSCRPAAEQTLAPPRPPSPPPAADPEARERALEVAAAATDEDLVGALQRHFGHSHFRGKQLETVRALLHGDSCISIMPTGQGKSLCFQLPALLLPGLTLVVTPLIALMLDQVASAPKELLPAALWSGQTRAQALEVLDGIRAGKNRLLFVSPERLSSPHFLAAIEPHLPLSLIVIDECHCMTEWGHSFRPSYYRLGKLVATPELNSRSVLALTATCTEATQADIANRLGIRTVFRDASIRDNLRISVSSPQIDPTMGSAVTWATRLFTHGALKQTRSAVVFCAFKELTNSIAASLRGAGIAAAAYHAGKNQKERAEVVDLFTRGKLRVVAATVAFGMGIHIPNLAAVVHVSLPRSPEEYVQQIGRAGREGNEARCYAYLDDAELLRLRSLSYSGAVELATVRDLLRRVLCPSADVRKTKAKRALPDWPYRQLDLSKLTVEMDVKEDVVESVLAHLEVREPALIRLYMPTALRVKISFYGAPPEEVAERFPIIAALLSLGVSPRNGTYHVATADLANAAGAPPGIVLRDLSEVAASKQIAFAPSQEDGPTFRLLRRDADADELAEPTWGWVTSCLVHQVRQLDTTYAFFRRASRAASAELSERSLREDISAYMSRAQDAKAAGTAGLESAVLDPAESPLVAPSPALLASVRSATRHLADCGVAPPPPLALAKMLHGLASPAYPADAWRKRAGPFWGSQCQVDFAAVLRATKAVRASEVAMGT